MTIQKSIFLLLIFALCIGTKSTSQLTYESNGNTHLWGPIQISDLESEPYNQWFTNRKADYQPTIDQDLYTGLNDVTVKIYLGTWCGDTKNFVPKFVKLWDLAGLNKNQLSLMALHSKSDLYKQAPDGSDKIEGIHRVPTFIFEREGKEIARIVEEPVTSLPIDVAQISAGLPTKPNYSAVAALQKYFADINPDSLYQQYDQIERKVFRNVNSISELTTYAKKLHTEGDIEKAEFVYKLAHESYPYHPYPHYRLGLFHFDCENWELSKEQFMLCQEKKLGYRDSFDYLSKLEEKLLNEEGVK